MTQDFILLDGGQGLLIIPLFFLIHLVTTILIEGTVLFFFKYNLFKICLLDAFVVNQVSFISGVLLYYPFHTIADKLIPGNQDENLWILLFLYFIQTILVEGIILKMRNKTFPTRKLILANIVMNSITYITLYILLLLT